MEKNNLDWSAPYHIGKLCSSNDYTILDVKRISKKVHKTITSEKFKNDLIKLKQELEID